MLWLNLIQTVNRQRYRVRAAVGFYGRFMFRIRLSLMGVDL